MLFTAWANEIFAQFWFSINSRKIAKNFVIAANTAWEKWGADGKCSNLLFRFPDIMKSINSSTTIRRNSARRSKLTGPGSKDSQNTENDDFTIEGLRNVSSFNRKAIDIDINTVLKVTNSITNETNLQVLVDKILGHLMNNTGATRAVFFINEKGNLRLEKILNSDGVESFEEKDSELHAPLSLLNYVFRTQDSKVYSDSPTESFIANDPYIEKHHPKSILCCPIQHQNIITGAIYLENRLQSGSFTSTRVNLVKSLMASASISIANAQLLRKNQELSQALQNSNGATVPKYNLETPMQKVFDAINSIKERFENGDPILNTLDVVLSTLMSDGLFSANLGEVNDKDGMGIDQDTKNWIESSLLMSKRSNHDVTDRKVAPMKTQVNLEIDSPTVIFQDISNIKLNEVNEMLELSGEPSFDCFKLAELTDGKPLRFLTTHMLAKYGLNEAFGLNPRTVQNFLQKIESSYNKLPYHNRY